MGVRSTVLWKRISCGWVREIGRKSKERVVCAPFMCEQIQVRVHTNVCVCVRERERESDRACMRVNHPSKSIWSYAETTRINCSTSKCSLTFRTVKRSFFAIRFFYLNPIKSFLGVRRFRGKKYWRNKMAAKFRRIGKERKKENENNFSAGN